MEKNHEFLVVGGIWGVVAGGIGPRLAPEGGNTVGGGGEGEGTPTTIPAPEIKEIYQKYTKNMTNVQKNHYIPLVISLFPHIINI